LPREFVDHDVGVILKWCICRVMTYYMSE